MDLKHANDIYIDFSIFEKSDLDKLKKELKMMIDFGKHIYVWSEDKTEAGIALWCIDHGLYDYVWDYRVKDSRNYQCPDFVIDPSEKFVRMFKNQGIPGNVVEKL